MGEGCHGVAFERMVQHEHTTFMDLDGFLKNMPIYIDINIYIHIYILIHILIHIYI